MRKALLVVVALMLVWGMAFAVPSALGSMPGPGPHGEQCGVDQFAFYGLTNTIRPGEIGLKTSLGCNTPASLTVHQWLLQANGNGGWISINETYAQKNRQGVLAIGFTTWYKCGSIDKDFASNHLQAKASWDMNFNTGWNTFGDNATEHWTKCYNPYVVEQN